MFRIGEIAVSVVLVPALAPPIVTYEGDIFPEEAGEGVGHRIIHLTNRLRDGLLNKGYRIASSRSPTDSSGILAFTSDLHDHAEIQRHLQSEHRIVIAVRCGRLRASPHFYNSDREIDQLIEALPKH
jgi:selenocysteine lyase/cysteine desulfurase